eukprot:m.21307 g.21307  ORF g.21307 m.21307 type:complete len:119 (+) comp3612_c0_seq2:33-389(+)
MDKAAADPEVKKKKTKKKKKKAAEGGKSKSKTASEPKPAAASEAELQASMEALRANPTLRWEHALDDATLEQARIERYKEARRQRYIAHRRVLLDQFEKQRALKPIPLVMGSAPSAPV